MVEGEALVTGFCVGKGRGRCDSEGDGEEEELRNGKWKSVALDSAEVPRPHPRLLGFSPIFTGRIVSALSSLLGKVKTDRGIGKIIGLAGRCQACFSTIWS
jgi:hypothetical protein